LAISKPQVIQKDVDGRIHEPYEQIVIDVEEIHQGLCDGRAWSKEKRSFKAWSLMAKEELN
jgi:predicted membrane GTPase involved in stress response